MRMVEDREWTPTAVLRWIQRPDPYDDDHLHRILQQWWQVPGLFRGEWRDVPTGVE